jgi:NTE family protein
MRFERITLVLSGGGMKANAHVGVLRALAEAGIRPASIIATSAGAFVGALAAGGMDVDAITALVCGLTKRDYVIVNRASLLARGIGATGVLRPEPLHDLLTRVLPVQAFDRLVLPLRITAVDLDSGELTVFGAGGITACTVGQAVYASMALPLYFPPAVIGGRSYADGGVLAVLPLGLVQPGEADLVIAVDTGPAFAAHPEWRRLAPRMLGWHDRSLGIAMADQRERTIAAYQTDAARPPLLLVRPAVDPHGTFAFDRTRDFIAAGYRAAHAALAARVRA